MVADVTRNNFSEHHGTTNPPQWVTYCHAPHETLHVLESARCSYEHCMVKRRTCNLFSTEPTFSLQWHSTGNVRSGNNNLQSYCKCSPTTHSPWAKKVKRCTAQVILRSATNWWMSWNSSSHILLECLLENS